VAFAVDRTVDAAVVVVRTIEPVVPNAITLVVVALEENIPVLNVKLFKSNVPFVNVVVFPVPVVKALPNVHAPPIPLNVTAPPKATPFVVTVLPVVVALNVVVPV